MPLQSSGAISLDDIEEEFGGSAPTSLSEYYAAATGIPSSGEISIEDFYGKSKPVNLTSGVNVQSASASDYISAGGTLTIPSGTYIWSNSTSTPALTIDLDNVTIINNGYIIGKGGNGGHESAGTAGGPAIRVTGSNVTITNNSGAYIAGGGGGGGGGWGAAGGSAGSGSTLRAGGAGGKAIEVTSGGNAYVTNNGTIYGTSEGSATTTLTSSAAVNGEDNRKQITASTFISAGETLIIPSDMWVWSDDRTVAALTIDISCNVINYGKVIGKGGNGATLRPSGQAALAQSGGPAIKINSSITGVTITNKAGAYIAGGGGGGGTAMHDGYSAGGGGGAGGGRGGNSNGCTGGAGGALNAQGSAGTTEIDVDGEGQARYYYSGRGGQAGGGGSNADYDGGNKGAGAGGGGGRILPGALGAAANGVNTGAGRGGGENWQAGAGAIYSSAHGGVAGNAAPNYNGLGGAAGGGGWGAAGGTAREGSHRNGGAGGKAVEDSGNTYTLTNNGTIYGATT